MLSLQVLIPTYNKKIEDIQNKCSFWNLETDALISVQSDHYEEKSFYFKDHLVTVIFNTTKGVSVNRNILIKKCSADIGVFIDDDCSMVSGYYKKIIDFYEQNSCDCVCFNGFLPQKNSNVLIHNSKSKKVTKFHDVSSVGGPGFSAKSSFLKSSAIRFDEKLGTPNFIVLGEDSTFIKNIFDSGCLFYRSSDPVFKIEEDLDNSSYFNGFGDYRFLISKGFVCKNIYKNFYFIVKHIHALKLSKKNNLKLSTILKLYDIGASLKRKKEFNKLIYIDLKEKKTVYFLEKAIDFDSYYELISEIYTSMNRVNIDEILIKKNIAYRTKKK